MSGGAGRGIGIAMARAKVFEGNMTVSTKLTLGK
jgi:hypothetical protein